MEGEQFSLCWNNFHNNLSSGFHTLLQDEDLVDVTLAAEGRYLKAHKTVLSVCSPYFKELFRVNPCKHPIVILQDVSYSALQNLLQFMYQGEVSVSQEEIPTFMRVAEMLKVKGLTDNTSNADTNGIDSHKNAYSSTSDNKQFLKRKPIKKIIKPIQHLKPIESPRGMKSPPQVRTTPQTPAKQARYDDTSAPSSEYLPIGTINPKQEPADMIDDFREQSYDDHSMDMSSMLDTTLGEPSDSKALIPTHKLPTDTSSPVLYEFTRSKKGMLHLVYENNIYRPSGKTRHSSPSDKPTHPYWECVKNRKTGCKARLLSREGLVEVKQDVHNHPSMEDYIQTRMKLGAVYQFPL